MDQRRLAASDKQIMCARVVFLSEDEKEAETEKNRGKKSLSKAAIWVSSHSSVSAEKSMTEVRREGGKHGEMQEGGGENLD